MDLSEDQIRQAIFTWTYHSLPSGKQGYGFASVSPALKLEFEQFQAYSREFVGFVGNPGPAEKDRASYRPIGRHVIGNTALAYRKQDAGVDGHERKGNYLVHFLISPALQFPLSDVLRIPNDQWKGPSRALLQGNLQLEDLPLALFRESLQVSARIEIENSQQIVDAIEKIAHTGTADLTGWDPILIQYLIATLPPWFDYSANLVPRWAERGSTLRLEIAASSFSMTDVADRRASLVNPDLQEIRRRLGSTSSLAELRYAFVSEPVPSIKEVRGLDNPPVSLSPLPSSAPDQQGTQHSLERCVDKWITEGTKSLSSGDHILLLRDASQTIQVMEKSQYHIPSAKKLDKLALSLLDNSDQTDLRLLYRILPIEDEAVSMYVALCRNGAVLKAAVLLNAQTGRTIDLVFQTGVAPAVLRDLVEFAKTSTEFNNGLLHSIRISSLGTGSFVRRLFLCDDVDFDYLYSKILPTAAAGRADTLLSVAGINAEAFVRWTAIPEPYADALVDALRHETRDVVWDRISRFAGSWRKR